jgi:hypothetical protein
MVAPTWITPGCVQFLENRKRFHTAWANCRHAANGIHDLDRLHQHHSMRGGAAGDFSLGLNKQPGTIGHLSERQLVSVACGH